MAQPAKGDRMQMLVRADTAVYQRVLALVQDGKASSISQAVADLLAYAVGLPTKARDLTEAPQLALWNTDHGPDSGVLPRKTA